MEFFVDIADIEKVEKVAEYFPIDGCLPFDVPSFLERSLRGRRNHRRA